MHLGKRTVIRVCAAALTLTMATGIASAAYGTGTVSAGSLRLRSEASTKSETLDIFSKGTQVTVLEEATDGWYKVTAGDLTGFMSAEYLDVTPLAEETTAPEDEKAAAEDVEVYIEEELEAETEQTLARVTTSVLNVRSGAGTGYDRLGKVYSGDVVTVLSQADGWLEVEFESLHGYVSAEYLNILDPNAPAQTSSLGAELAERAKQYLGVRYKYGGASPSGFDCSGLIYYICKAMGYSIPRTATPQWEAGYTKVDKADLQPGDLVFFTKTYHSSKYITHVGIYVGGGKFIHASSPTSGGVIYSSLSEKFYSTRYVGARRIFN